MKAMLAAICGLSVLATDSIAVSAFREPVADAPASARAAVEHIRRAAATMVGPGDPLAAENMSWQLEGRLFWLNQGPTPEQPLELGLRQQQFIDFGAGLTFVAFEFSSPESSFRRATVLRHQPGSEELLELFGVSPLAVLRMLGRRPADLRVIGHRDGSMVIAGPLLGRLVQLELGPDGLPRSLSYLFTDDLFGDSVRRFDYLDYRRTAGRAMPARIRQTDAGRVVLDASVAGLAVGGAGPGWTAGLEPRPAHPPDDGRGFGIERIAPGIHYLKQHGGSDYHGLAVELAEGWMVLETPLAIGDGAQLRRALSAIADRPIAYAVATHHHDDHSAGMAALAAPGTTVLTTPGNLAYFRTMVEAERGYRPRPGRARVEALEPGQRIGPVRFLNVGTTAHARELLIFYFPEHRLLFHSDMGRFNEDGTVEPARSQTCALLSFIEESGLAVERIYSGHGRPGTMEDLRRSVAMRDEPCPALA